MSEMRYMPRAMLDELIAAIRDAGYRVIGPREESGQGGLVYREIGSAGDLPCGLQDEQAPGRYRLPPFLMALATDADACESLPPRAHQRLFGGRGARDGHLLPGHHHLQCR